MLSLQNFYDLNLPYEIIYIILLNLNLTALISLRIINKKWKLLFDDIYFIKIIINKIYITKRLIINKIYITKRLIINEVNFWKSINKLSKHNNYRNILKNVENIRKYIKLSLDNNKVKHIIIHKYRPIKTLYSLLTRNEYLLIRNYMDNILNITINYDKRNTLYIYHSILKDFKINQIYIYDNAKIPYTIKIYRTDELTIYKCYNLNRFTIKEYENIILFLKNNLTISNIV